MAALDLVKPELRRDLDEQMFEAACEGFKREATVEFRKDVAVHVRDGTLYVIMGGGRAMGFAVMKDFPEAGGTYISGIVKGGGTPSGIVERIVAEHARKFSVVAVRTQNDRVVEIIKDICDEVVPIDREAGEREFEILRQMELFSDRVQPNLVIKQHFGGRPMIGDGERRRSRDGRVRQATERLDYQNGDAMLLIGYRKVLE